MFENEDCSLDVATNEKHNIKITNEEWFEISLALEVHHAVFYTIWQMGKPVFTEEINGRPLDTAAVQWDENGKFIWFYFNPKFWKRLDFYNKLFVICHESLHIILNHGLRTKNRDRANKMAANSALDIVVNHSILNNFGFERNKINDWQEYCWIDTLFKDKKPMPSDDETFEFYYNLFDRVYGDGQPIGIGTVDDHDGMGENAKNWDEAIEALNDKLSPEEKESLKSLVDKHFQEGDPQKNQQAGTGTGQWVFVTVNKIKKKKKWETVIKNWSKKFLINKDRDIEQWARLQRRLTMLPKQMFLPSEMEVDDDKEKTRIKVWFYLDTSGSCWGLKDRFFTAALSLPSEKFDVRLFCFDTAVQETTLESRKVYGGGGTAFSILEKEIQKEIEQKGERYPEAIFVITDGYGDNIKPQFPTRWYWFITEGGTKTHIDTNCHFYNLRDFE